MNKKEEKWTISKSEYQRIKREKTKNEIKKIQTKRFGKELCVRVIVIEPDGESETTEWIGLKKLIALLEESK